MHRISLPLLALNVLMLVFAASALLSVKTAYDVSLSEGSMVELLASVGLYFVVAYGARRMSLAKIMAGAGAVIAVGIAFVFITQFDYQNYPETPTIIQRLGKLTTLLPNLNLFYLHPNAVATFLDMALPITLALVVATRRAWRGLWSICAILMLYAMFLTVSRGAWIGLVIAGLLLGMIQVMRRLSRGRAILLVSGGIVALGVLVAGVIVVGPRIPALHSSFEAAASRLELYRNSLYLIRDYAFTGIGLGDTFAMVYSRYSLLIFVPFLTYSHNLPLAVWFGQGLPGILSFIGIIILFYIYVYRVIRHGQPNALFYGAWLGVTVTLIHGLDDARQYVESPWVMPALFFAIGLALACGYAALKQSEAETVRVSNRRGVVLAAVLGLIVVVGVFLARGTLVALWYTNLGALDETRSDSFITPDMEAMQRAVLVDTARDWYEKALAADPDLPDANRRLGNLLIGQDDYAEAVPLLEKGYAAEPDNPAAIKGLGLAYVWVGRTSDAAATLKQLPDPKAMTDELGTWHQYREDQKQPLLAAYALETALLMSNEPSPLDVELLLADDYRAGGDPERARNWYENVLAQDANNARALDGLAKLGT